MSPWARRRQTTVPPMSSARNVLEINDYSLGFNSFFSNDKMPVKNGGSNMWRLAQDARITTLGDYGTRKGFDFHSAAAGETQDQAITSVTGAADKTFTTTTRLAQPFTAGTSGRLSKVDINLKNTASGTGTILVEIWSNVSSAPGLLLARSSIAASTPTGSYAYSTAYFPDAPAVVSTTVYWIVVYVQATGLNSYSWSSTTSATSAKTSTNSGLTWSSTSYALNFKQYYATSGGVLGQIRAYKSDGTTVTVFAHGTSVYKVDNVTGALTAIKTGLSASATNYQFFLVNDIIYYVNGFDGYRKWDFTTESQVNATNYTLLTVHKGIMFLQQKDDPNRIDYSNFGIYETFTSTDFLTVPAPKTGDPTTALLSLNGYLLIFTKNNKYILSGADNATFQINDAPDQKGTFRQETVTADKNFTYYLSDDGVYRSNGSEAQSLSENIYQDILSLVNKATATLCVNNGRLYMWYTTSGAAANNECYVWNLNFSSGSDTVESLDQNAYVSRAVSAYGDNNALLVGNSVIGRVMWQELPSNDYSNLGGAINTLFQTHYLIGSSPAVLKEYRNWQPRFGAQSGNYAVSCEYAYDLRNTWTSAMEQNVQGSGYVWGSSATVWGAFTWGTTAEVQSYLRIPGQYRRTAVRYKHYACRQPFSFLGHSLVSETRRIR